MCYEDLENARAERAAKACEKEAKKANMSKAKRSRKRKSSTEADASEPMATITQASRAEEGEVAPAPWQAPVARMW
jgi:hypothetical protein